MSGTAEPSRGYPANCWWSLLGVAFGSNQYRCRRYFLPPLHHRTWDMFTMKYCISFIIKFSLIISVAGKCTFSVHISPPYFSILIWMMRTPWETWWRKMKKMLVSCPFHGLNCILQVGIWMTSTTFKLAVKSYNDYSDHKGSLLKKGKHK